MTEPKKKYLGKILSLNKKGFGFIVADPKFEELKFKKIFFHWTALKNETVEFGDLNKRDEVEFELIDLPDKGLRAVSIDVFENKDKTNVKGTVVGNVGSNPQN